MQEIKRQIRGAYDFNSNPKKVRFDGGVGPKKKKLLVRKPKRLNSKTAATKLFFEIKEF